MIFFFACLSLLALGKLSAIHVVFYSSNHTEIIDPTILNLARVTLSPSRARKVTCTQVSNFTIASYLQSKPNSKSLLYVLVDIANLRLVYFHPLHLEVILERFHRLRANVVGLNNHVLMGTKESLLSPNYVKDFPLIRFAANISESPCKQSDHWMTVSDNLSVARNWYAKHLEFRCLQPNSLVEPYISSKKLDLITMHEQHSLSFENRIAMLIQGPFESRSSPELLTRLVDNMVVPFSSGIPGSLIDVFLVTPEDNDLKMCELLAGLLMQVNMGSVYFLELDSSKLGDENALEELLNVEGFNTSDIANKRLLDYEGVSFCGRGLWRYYMDNACLSLLETHELKFNFKYDWVVRTRGDLYWQMPHLPFQVLNHSHQSQDEYLQTLTFPYKSSDFSIWSGVVSGENIEPGGRIGIHDMHSVFGRRAAKYVLGTWRALAKGDIRLIFKQHSDYFLDYDFGMIGPGAEFGLGTWLYHSFVTHERRLSLDRFPAAFYAWCKRGSQNPAQNLISDSLSSFGRCHPRHEGRTCEHGPGHFLERAKYASQFNSSLEVSNCFAKYSRGEVYTPESLFRCFCEFSLFDDHDPLVKVRHDSALYFGAPGTKSTHRLCGEGNLPHTVNTAPKDTVITWLRDRW